MRRLLILDDDEALGATLAHMAARLGIEARAVTCPAVFEAEIAAWQPTDIFVDLVMPKVDGMEILELLRRLQCHARLFLISGAGGRVLDAARRSGEADGLTISGVLKKPFMRRDLEALLLTSENSSTLSTAPNADRPSNQLSLQDIKKALQHRQFEVYFQPKVYAHNRMPAGFEALVRLRHASMGIVQPGQFIHLVENTSLMHALTDQVVSDALTWAAHYLAEDDLSISINLSAISMTDPDIVGRLDNACRAVGLPCRNVILELTETSALTNPAMSLKLLTRMRLKGFQLSIDDFGTGHSSLAQLADFPFSELKVDKGFVLGSDHSLESRAIVQTCVDLAKSLGLKVTAEGVESAQVAERLELQGCDLLQGYFIAPPMPAAAAARWLLQHSIPSPERLARTAG